MTSNPSTSSVQGQAAFLEQLLRRLQAAETLPQKISCLDALPTVQAFVPELLQLAQAHAVSGEHDLFLLKSLAAIGQAKAAFGGDGDFVFDEEAFGAFLNMLRALESAYSTIGGIIGYQLTVLKLICAKRAGPKAVENTSYAEPEGLDLSKDMIGTRQAVRWGIESVGKVGEIYPIGGAGDRLNLQDDATGELLPAAQLQFCGRSLLEGMVRDLQAREFLHYRLFGRQHTTPLAMMTSQEKRNHQRVIAICEQRGWFGRPKESMCFFMQPLVPVVTIEGQWALCAPLKPMLKPGGHGVMWKVAIDAGVFDWFERQGCQKVLVRQINNPVAGVDNGLLTLVGEGCGKRKSFGFASCARLLNTAEGMNVVKERRVDHGGSVEYEYGITNVEYVDFALKGIKDVPVSEGSPFSRFPSNTNILFADLAAVRKAVAVCPIPGMLINMKSKVVCQGARGETAIEAGRLESIMQNIADYIVDRFPRPLEKGEYGNLSTFLTYNDRLKTISVTKQAFVAGGPFIETPEGCFYDLLQNYRDLLSTVCAMELPPSESAEEHVAQGPSFVVLFHPALGPLYEVIGQKIRGGRIAPGSEWQIEAAEVDIKELDLDGSLLVEAEAPLGKPDVDGCTVYDSAACGKCTLHNVVVRNRGIDRSRRNIFWKMAVDRLESVRIHVRGNGEFFAKDVVLEGDLRFEVPEGHRLEVFNEHGQLKRRLTKIDRATWTWDYAFDGDNRVKLTRR